MRERNQWLDVLRGLAILLVLGWHSGYVPIFRALGWSGVDLFFVLSGYLIAGLLFSEYRQTGQIRVCRFWVRRGFKIYPGFWVLLGATVAILYLTQAQAKLKWVILGNLFFLQNYIPRVNFMGHTWSLAVEEHFYLLLPLLLLLLTRAKGRYLETLPAISVGLAFLCLALRSTAASWAPTHLRIDSLFCGVTLSYYEHFRRDCFPSRSHGYFLAWGLAALGFVLMFGERASTLTLTFLGYACILLWAVPRNPSGSLLVRGLAWVGRYSYSIYLWHVLCLLSVMLVFQWRATFVGCVAYFVTSIAIGVGMAKLVEFPALKLREHVMRGRALAARTPQRMSPLNDVAA